MKIIEPNAAPVGQSLGGLCFMDLHVAPTDGTLTFGRETSTNFIMTDTQRAKAMLTAMPDEVFELWIQHCVLKSGWPYNQITDRGDDYWKGYFLGIPLTAIRAFKWNHMFLSFSPSLFEKETSIMIKKMVLLHAHNINPGVIVPADSKGRFDSAVSYLEEHGKIPGSIVLFGTANGFMVFDGWHRLAAVHTLEETTNPIELPCWIATPNEAAPEQAPNNSLLDRP